MNLVASFADRNGRPPSKLADLAYIKSERAASHETPVLLDFVTSWMEERGYAVGLACLDLLLEKKCNLKDNKRPLTRQDGVTPSVIHELSQAIYTISLVEAGYDLPDVETLLCLNFIHDLGEEFDITEHQLAEHLKKSGVPRSDRTTLLGELFENMTKSRDGQYLYVDNRAYFLTMLDDPNTVIAKFQDRIHNMATLIGVKSHEKHVAYITETMELRETLSRAQKRYPEYADVFEIMDNIVKAQVFFNSIYLNKVDPQNPVFIASSSMPRLRSINPLPSGLDPLQITQTRALATIARKNAGKDPHLTPSA